MANYPTLTLGFDIRSVCKSTPEIEVVQYDDGYKSVFPKGVLNRRRSYTIVQKVVSLAEASTLRSFLVSNSQGQAITVPVYNEDPTGSTTSDFYIVDWSDTFSDSQILPTFSIAAEEF